MSGPRQLPPLDATLHRRFSLDISLFEIDVAAGTFRTCSRWAAMLGLEPETRALTTTDWLNRIDVRDRDRVEIELTTHIEGLSTVFETEFRMSHGDGSLRWIRTRGRAQENEDGSRVVSGHQEDVTGRHSWEEKLRRSEARFRTLVENCPDAVAVHRDGRWVYVNQLMCDLLGRDDPKELCGQLVLESIHPDDYAEVAARVRRLTTGASESEPPREIRLRRADGSSVVAEVASLRLSFDGEPAIFAIARDVTERKKIQARLAHTDRMANLGTLAAGVAHEINNPMTYVTANLQTLLSELPLLADKVLEIRNELERLVGASRAEKLAEKAGPLLQPSTYEDLLEQAKDAHHGSLRVTSIVSGLRQFARSDEKPHTSVSLERVVETALKIAAHEVRYRAKIVRNIELVPEVLGDEGKLGQVVLNLLVNAAHAIEPGHVNENEIRVNVRTQGESVLIEVEDTGSGIPAEKVGRIFDPFFTTKPPGVGSGLGLSICQHIIEEHGGKIGVQTTPGQGTRFTVEIPRLREAPGPTVEGKEADSASGKLPAPEARARILIIDDEPRVCSTLKRALGHSYDVSTATGGREAISLLERDDDFDLLLCDVMMMDLSGPQVYAWLSEHRPALIGRIVFITGGATNPQAAEFLSTVESPVLEKPVDLDDLLHLVHAMVVGPKPDRCQVRSIERRQGARFRANGIAGVVEDDELLSSVTVVDYSESGMRVASIGGQPPWRGTMRLRLSLHQGDALVRARVHLVREVRTPGGVDLCFRIDSMDEDSRATYLTWLARAAQSGTAVRH